MKDVLHIIFQDGKPYGVVNLPSVPEKGMIESHVERLRKVLRIISLTSEQQMQANGHVPMGNSKEDLQRIAADALKSYLENK